MEKVADLLNFPRAASEEAPPRGALTAEVGRRDARGSRGRSRETGLIAPAVGAPEELQHSAVTSIHARPHQEEPHPTPAA